MNTKRRTAAAILATLALLGIWSFSGNPHSNQQVQRQQSMHVADGSLPAPAPTDDDPAGRGRGWDIK